MLLPKCHYNQEKKQSFLLLEGEPSPEQVHGNDEKFDADLAADQLIDQVINLRTQPFDPDELLDKKGRTNAKAAEDMTESNIRVGLEQFDTDALELILETLQQKALKLKAAFEGMEKVPRDNPLFERYEKIQHLIDKLEYYTPRNRIEDLQRELDEEVRLRDAMPTAEEMAADEAEMFQYAIERQKKLKTERAKVEKMPNDRFDLRLDIHKFHRVMEKVRKLNPEYGKYEWESEFNYDSDLIEKFLHGYTMKQIKQMNDQAEEKWEKERAGKLESKNDYDHRGMFGHLQSYIGDLKGWI